LKFLDNLSPILRHSLRYHTEIIVRCRNLAGMRGVEILKEAQ